ncbi:MAG TPA: patatin-like phospholipase family protein [Spirochaetota bacterium]|nr:patatin-like phospholipase family protein [Spirochaetota bacterium]HOD14249.1 patatin-like phospholipase family protein [Spirochaetota bacterium]HPG50681.1 patatin-like phospholipase family protein [Spirochaetota bacterium]HPN12874.1 patatin-like phospholipase family protein [Spirochaetota bacterium]HQL82500.1 patatin-like phospholipase family protein [Spirochaetota bacterium]
MSNPLKFFGNRTVGLALGSGGAKGLSHIAVVEYLRSMEIPIHMIAGSSIGAVVGAIYCVGALDRFKQDILKLTLREMLKYMDPVVPRSGLIEGKGFVKFLERYVPPAALLEELEVPLAVVATDYATGAPVVFRSGNVLEALRASVSIPGVLVPVRYRDTLLVDGGVSIPLPISVVRGMGAGLTIAVNLHPRLRKRGLRHLVKSRVETPAPVHPEDVEIIRGGSALAATSAGGSKWLRLIEQWLAAERGTGGKNMPNIFDVIAQSVDIMEYINTALMLKYDSPTVLVEPNVTDVSTLNFADAGKIMYEGYLACSRVKGQLTRKIKAWV